MVLPRIIGRRPVLASAATLGASSLFRQTSQAAESISPPLELGTQAAQSAVYRKLAWSLDERVGFWWLQGTRYALVDAVMTPFWEMTFGLLFSIRDLPGGEYEVTNIPTSFYTDLATGELLRKFANPLTGKTVDVSYFPAKPSKSKYNVAGRIEAPAMAGMVSTSTIGPAVVEKGQVWLREENRVHGAAPGPDTKPFSVNDLSTFYASARELADPKLPMVPAGQMFSDILTYSRWLEMGDHPGFLYSWCHGRKVASIEDMPDKWRKLMQQEHPDIYKDPVAALHG